MPQPLPPSASNFGVSTIHGNSLDLAAAAPRTVGSDTNAFADLISRLAGNALPQPEPLRETTNFAPQADRDAEGQAGLVRFYATHPIGVEDQSGNALAPDLTEGEITSNSEDREAGELLADPKITILNEARYVISPMSGVQIHPVAGGSDDMDEGVTARFLSDGQAPRELDPLANREMPLKVPFVAIETFLPPIMIGSAREIAADVNQSAALKADNVQTPAIQLPVKILKIHLHPEELGALAIQIRMSGKLMRVDILTEQSSTATLLSHVKERLLHNLTDAGAEISVSDLRIGFTNTSQSGDAPASADRDGAGSNAPREQRDESAQRQSDQRKHENPNEDLRRQDPESAASDAFLAEVFI